MIHFLDCASQSWSLKRENPSDYITNQAKQTNLINHTNKYELFNVTKTMNHQCCNPNTPVTTRKRTRRLKIPTRASSKTCTSLLLLWLRKKPIPSMVAATMKLWSMMIILNRRWMKLIVRQQLSQRSGSQHQPVTVMRGGISILWYVFW